MSEQSVRIPADDGRFGRYDEESEAVLKRLGAQAVLLIVLKPGEPGFSVSTLDFRIVAELPAILRSVADNMEAQIKAKEGN